MSSQPLVSVCIPCYNGAPFIARTVESVLNQTFTNFELVLADDKSTDETLAVIETFTDPRMKVVRNPANLGMGNNWNHVLSLGVGKYVKLLCEDDLLHPSCLEHQVSILEDSRNSAVVLTVCNRNIVNSRGQIVLGPRHSLQPGVSTGRQLIKKCLRAGSNIIGEPAVGLFRREAMTKREMCDPCNPYLSDLSLWAEILRRGDAFVDSEVLASFRVSGGAATTAVGFRQAACFRRFMKNLQQDPVYRVDGFDLARAYVLSLAWCLLRNVFIWRQSLAYPHPTTQPTPAKGMVRAESHAHCS
ncbi:MAG TPA: glycosyltransferase family 2 protein [Verrucomicrobiae bacterium]|nr:glycosyltransferase family 2 protein [Verrucomicrobiae bacterium]